MWCVEGTIELVDLARGREVHLGSQLNEEPMEKNDLDDQPTPIVKAPSSPWVCPNTIKFCTGAFFGGFSCRCDENAIFMDILNKMSISNINKQHQKTIFFYFHNVWYGEDIIMRLHIFSLHICVTLWSFLFNIWCSFILVYLPRTYKMAFNMKIGHFLEFFQQ